ncbi:phosphoribosylanthranilate isomerase [Leptospira langatensis]|uniref:N-(5'-phosphoribosyl)anthranilate isomerase n=1 Tax=Leptospira langatensis TaxID=2484983 RepID=A0A5F1ZZU9_9LEPT|nr:phosphoribosylanthranilate isomerase [Leptospira langatensis]TGK04103.1 phosphoribosylanthranilate isomerase [Leptospira langatensis]TGL43583.1 phosphoribosylanthranilate isomerase [Leptospira langatensis]
MSQLPKVKICGLRQVDDLKVSIEEGADLIGLNFVSSSPRLVSPKEAEILVTYLYTSVPSFLRPKIVFLFYKSSGSFIESILKNLEYDYVQYVSDDCLAPGNTSPLYQERDARIISYRVKGPVSDDSLSFLDSNLLILDSFNPAAGGGTGERFPWEYVSEVKRPYLLAGGLNPENVSEALAQTGAYGVDVASGVESSPGVKDPNLIRKFIQNAKRSANNGK